MGSAKTEVVSVRVEPRIKEALQAAADLEMRSLANMVEFLVVDYCRARGIPVEPHSSGVRTPRTKGPRA